MNIYSYRFLLPLLVLLGLCGPSRAATPPTTGRSLAEALNSDGTLKAGAAGSFDARAFQMRTAPDGRPVFRPAGTTGVGDERWQDGLGLPNGTDGRVCAVVQVGSDIYIGGEFTVVGNVPANGVAKWNGTTWSVPGTGAAVVSRVNIVALAAAANGDVYAGGEIEQGGGARSNYLARWNGTAWNALGTSVTNSVNGFIHKLAVAGNGDVYVGGFFNQAGGVAASNVAKWNGTTWSALGAGTANGVSSTVVNVNVSALAVASNGDVYVGGAFTEAGGVAARNVAKLNGTTWSALGTGINDMGVGELAVAGTGDVYASGSFSQAGGVAVNHVAKWNGTTWSALGTGVANGANVRAVFAMAVAGNGDVYVGSHINQGGNNNVAKWNGTAWSSLSTGVANGLNGDIDVLAVAVNGDVYAGGIFTQASGTAANNVAKWNGSTWSSLRTGAANGVNGDINALAIAGNGDVYVGGFFTHAGGVAAYSVAKWNGTTWSALGTGVTNGTSVAHGVYAGKVFALAVAGNGDVYVGGAFNRAGGVAAYSVAKWNGTAWSALSTGAYYVHALAVDGSGNVYAGGRFTLAGDIAANYVAKWDGTVWSALGTGTANGVNGYVHSLAVAGNGDVYAGGEFDQAGGIAARSVAKWNGTAWSSLGLGVYNSSSRATVYTLAVAGNGDVYAGGSFTIAWGAVANKVAKWNGTAWSALGTGAANGVNGTVSALTVASNGDVYVSGQFSQAGGAAASSVAKFNGTAWSTLGTGLSAPANALAVGQNGKFYAGGTFKTTGDGSKAMAHFGIYDSTAPLATAGATRTAPVALFPNPAHGTATLRLPAGTPRLPLTLTDALGRIVRRYPAPAGPDATLDLRGLPAGVYMVSCGQVTQRLVVE